MSSTTTEKRPTQAWVIYTVLRLTLDNSQPPSLHRESIAVTLTKNSTTRVVRGMADKLAKEKGWTAGGITVYTDGSGMSCEVYGDIAQTIKCATVYGLLKDVSEGEETS